MFLIKKPFVKRKVFFVEENLYQISSFHLIYGIIDVIMSILDNNKQSKKIKEIKGKEEEAFLEHISKKFNIPYINLEGSTIETDALGILTEAQSRLANVACFKVTGKDLYVGVRSPNLPETKKIIAELKKKYNV